MKKSYLIALSVVFLLLAIFFAVKAILGPSIPSVAPKQLPAAETTPEAEPAGERQSQTSAPAPTNAAETESSPAAEETPEPYVSPIDFEGLRETVPDIYGWLTIEDTNIDYPVVQHPTNDRFYMNHDSEGNFASKGAVFSEATYNGTDFSDPVTLLYGHHMSSGAIFGNLQRYYSDSEWFDAHPTFTIYTPEAELTYGVFAAVPYSSEHLLYYNDFSNDAEFERFFSAVFNIRDLSARFNSDYAPEPGDRVVILSTCLASNNQNRFLVMATQIEKK